MKVSIFTLLFLSTCAVSTQPVRARSSEGFVSAGAVADTVTEQHTQSIHKIVIKRLNGYTFKVDSVGFPTLDGVAMAIDEQNPTNTVYSGGNAVVIVYQSGKVAMMIDGKFVGYMK